MVERSAPHPLAAPLQLTRCRVPPGIQAALRGGTTQTPASVSSVISPAWVTMSWLLRWAWKFIPQSPGPDRMGRTITERSTWSGSHPSGRTLSRAESTAFMVFLSVHVNRS
ncbi:hypothetical protein, partial [Burkholderia sola]|uniref:hypothetical protein n=1 Tax=Burkholderia sola TaxID=2843302 RepID=UPI00338E525E